jgi:hypothetical protein
LETAASKVHVEVAPKLLSHGASVDITMERSCTYLSSTVERGYLGKVRELLKYIVNLNVTKLSLDTLHQNNSNWQYGIFPIVVEIFTIVSIAKKLVSDK